MSITRASRPKENFYVLRNEISGDRSLSWAARGMLIYLLSKPDNWVISIQNLVNETVDSGSPMGRDGVYKVINQLIAAGYVSRVQSRDGGKMAGVQYVASEVCQPLTDSPLTDLPDTASPLTANPTLLNTEIKLITDTTKNAPSNASDTTPSDAFQSAVAAQSKFGRQRLNRATAWSLWQRLSKKHGEDKLLAAYLRYLATDTDANRDGGAYQAGLQRWLKEKSDQWLEQVVRRSRPVDVDTIRAMIKTRDATPSFAWPEDRLGMTESEARKMIA